ncbi:MAG TPA: hypothetical protein VHA33_22280 [Candidatus Angelobacter sp.]|jgi:hypothetical protein|nr:hypothetical protein [Candidatus Angelobacter sp.]
MQPRSFAVAVLLLFVFILDNNGVSVPVQSADRDQQAQEREFLARRENFKSGRELLLTKRVPFDPDELLRDGWTEKLKPTFDAMPEMRETHYETAPLKGVYLADTIYLPEKVQITGHTIILANYIVFEGKNPIIKGNYDLHFFPMQPVAVLETTLSELLHKKAGVLDVKLRRNAKLPSFSLLSSYVSTSNHVITLDASAPEPQALRPQPKKANASIRAVAWNEFPALAPAQKQCTSSCEDNGGVGFTGSTGTFGPPGNPGDSQPKAANGSCSGIINGVGGAFGGDGQPGGPGGTGAQGGTGGNGGAINLFVKDNDTNKYVISSRGGRGGQGGLGGNAGIGGNGGRGGDGGDGVACDCQNIGQGGDAGHGGGAGPGGKGGTGGQGGIGGNGGKVTASLPFNGTLPDIFVAGGQGGPGGVGGFGGVGGNPGQPGNPGKGATSSCGQTAPDGSPNVTGSGGDSGAGGDAGPNGTPGADGPTPSTTNRQPPSSGGVTPNPCLNGATATPGSGNFTTSLGLGVTPTCSPIIIDTRGEGFPLTSAQAGVMFDITGTGQAVQLAWTERGSHDAFLALPGPDGLVHNGKELFGNFTPQPASANPNGFLALAEFDKPANGGNGDGIIDERDAVFSRLRLWVDENHDGVCQVHELHTLPELGVFSLALKYRESRRTDDFGNQFRYKAKVNPDPADGESDVGRWTYDVFLTTVKK